jgi:hypothetical protein
MFDHVLEMNLAFDQRRPSNHLITVIAHGANAARDMLNLTAVSFGRDAMTPGGLVPVMVAQEPVMSAICLGCQAACSRQQSTRLLRGLEGGVPAPARYREPPGSLRCRLSVPAVFRPGCMARCNAQFAVERRSAEDAHRRDKPSAALPASLTAPARAGLGTLW